KLHEAMVINLHVVKRLLLSNRELVSPILIVLFFSNFALNIYFLTMLMLKPMTLDQQLLIVTCIALQFLIIPLALQPMIQSAKLVHHFAPILSLVQPRLPPQMLRLKLQALVYYEQNHVSGENKIAYTLGPFGKISTSS